MLQERNTEIKTGEMAGRQISPGSGNICHIILNGRHVTKTETTVAAQVTKSNAALIQARSLAPRMPSCCSHNTIAVSHRALKDQVDLL